jgi:hypothetical protein
MANDQEPEGFIKLTMSAKTAEELSLLLSIPRKEITLLSADFLTFYLPRKDCLKALLGSVFAADLGYVRALLKVAPQLGYDRDENGYNVADWSILVLKVKRDKNFPAVEIEKSQIVYSFLYEHYKPLFPDDHQPTFVNDHRPSRSSTPNTTESPHL